MNNLTEKEITISINTSEYNDLDFINHDHNLNIKTTYFNWTGTEYANCELTGEEKEIEKLLNYCKK